MRPRLLAGLFALGLLLAAPAPAAAAEFGFRPGPEGLSVALEEEDGSPALRAGRHPYELGAEINFKEGSVAGSPAQDPKDLRLQLPAGLIGNPAVARQCPVAQFATPRTSPYEQSSSGESCPDKSQVGTITLRSGLLGGGQRTFGLFELTPPPGVAAELGASPFGQPLAFSGVVRNDQGEYGLDLQAREIPQDLAIDGVSIEIWGTPWDASHDSERGDCLKETDPSFGWGKCSVGPPKTNRPLPFLTLPASCQGPLAYRAQVDSWQAPGHWLGAWKVAQTGRWPGPGMARRTSQAGSPFCKQTKLHSET